MSSETDTTKAMDHAEAQRNRILDAARQCFIEHGFHAASMSNIAETAGISQGLAYRYFKNKNAIILAIIERQLGDRRLLIDEIKTSEQYLNKILLWLVSPNQVKPNTMDPVLFLEMSAESSRDKEVRSALLNADSQYRADFFSYMRQFAKQAGTSISDEELEARFFALQCIIEGVFIRNVRQEIKARELNRYVAAFIAELLTLD